MGSYTSNWAKIFLVGIASIVTATHQLFQSYTSDLCLPSNLVSHEEQALTSLKCCIKCFQAGDCGGVCYSRETKQCKFFPDLSLEEVLSQLTADPGYVLWWKDYPTGCGRYGKKSYLAFKERYTSEVSKAMCKALNATLALPENALENVYLDSILHRPYIWLGMDDFDFDGDFTAHRDGSSVTFFHWSSHDQLGVPDEYCSTYGNGGKWYVEPCTALYGVVCELDNSGDTCQGPDRPALCSC